MAIDFEKGFEKDLGPKEGEIKMDENQIKTNNLIDTTDCLEAVGVFRGWKNGLFIIILVCLILLQGAFWLVNTGFVTEQAPVDADTASAVIEEVKQQPAAAQNEIQKAAKQIAGDANQPVEMVSHNEPAKNPWADIKISTELLSWLVGLLNFVLIITATLFCLTMLFCLKISLVARLGGINHIARAFFLSLFFLVLVLPWQNLFDGIIFGGIFTADEIFACCSVDRCEDLFDMVHFYLRFTGLNVLILLILIFSQRRSARWARNILRRLEVI